MINIDDNNFIRAYKTIFCIKIRMAFANATIACYLTYRALVFTYQLIKEFNAELNTNTGYVLYMK